MLFLKINLVCLEIFLIYTVSAYALASVFSQSDAQGIGSIGKGTLGHIQSPNSCNNALKQDS